MTNNLVQDIMTNNLVQKGLKQAFKINKLIILHPPIFAIH